MKIAFYDVTSTVSIGGIQTAIWELSNELASRGIEVHIYGGNGPIRPAGLNHSIKVFTFPFLPREKVPDIGSRFQRIIERLTMTFFARKRLRENSYDIIFTTKPFDFFLPYFTGGGNLARYAFLSQGTDFFPGDRALSKRISIWLSCSHFNAWQVMSRYKRYPRVIYNGVDTAKFHPMLPDAELKRSIGINEGETVFIFAGRLVGWKGVKHIVEAMGFEAVRKLPVKLLIIGNGPEKKRLEKMSSEMGLNERVVFLDFVPHGELPRYYSVADAAIYPSIGDEAFGISIAEAMACGKPVIASHIGGIPEVTGNDGSCGFLVSPTSPDEIAEKIVFLACNAAARSRMGESARLRVSENFTWKRSVDRLLDEIKTCL
ncbi:MAG: glycosyltransferase family 4 protein [Thermodesulfovibrionia bacterium]|nr:glycosyltransferase family 4 protein [Thermodesulfovibrionia bacterium]